MRLHEDFKICHAFCTRTNIPSISSKLLPDSVQAYEKDSGRRGVVAQTIFQVEFSQQFHFHALLHKHFSMKLTIIQMSS